MLNTFCNGKDHDDFQSDQRWEYGLMMRGYIVLTGVVNSQQCKIEIYKVASINGIAIWKAGKGLWRDWIYVRQVQIT